MSPFGHRILGGADTPACHALKLSFYGGATVEAVVGSVVMELSGRDIVGEDRKGAQIQFEEIICGHDLVPSNTLVIGILNTEHSWAYSRAQNTVDIHVEKSTTMFNTWYDVVVVNVCLLAYMHFLSDREKNPSHLITVVPEVLGGIAASVGIYRQQGGGGVYERVSDFDNAVLGCQMLTACGVLALVAHFAALLIEYDRFPHRPDDWKQWMRVRAARNFSHEYSLLASVFLQVACGVADAFQNYM